LHNNLLIQTTAEIELIISSWFNCWGWE